MKLQDNVRAVVVKEVQLRDRPGPYRCIALLHCCSRASPSTSSPTFNCPLPRLRRPHADLNAATTDKDCDPSGAPLVGQRTKGPGPGLVARVLWLYCMRLASSGVGGVRRVRLAFGRHPMHPPHTPDDASRIQNIYKTPTQLPTYHNNSRTRRTPPTPDDASRMQYSHKTRATSLGPGPIVYFNINLYLYIVYIKHKIMRGRGDTAAD